MSRMVRNAVVCRGGRSECDDSHRTEMEGFGFGRQADIHETVSCADVFQTRVKNLKRLRRTGILGYEPFNTLNNNTDGKQTHAIVLSKPRASVAGNKSIRIPAQFQDKSHTSKPQRTKTQAEYVCTENFIAQQLLHLSPSRSSTTVKRPSLLCLGRSNSNNSHRQ